MLNSQIMMQQQYQSQIIQPNIHQYTNPMYQSHQPQSQNFQSKQFYGQSQTSLNISENTFSYSEPKKLSVFPIIYKKNQQGQYYNKKELRTREWKVDVEAYKRKLEAVDNKMDSEEMCSKLAEQAKKEQEIESLKLELYWNRDFNIPNLYRTFDIDQNGDITVTEFQQALKNNYYLESYERDISNLFNQHSQDFHGFVQEYSFKSIFLPYMIKNKEHHIFNDFEQEEYDRIQQNHLLKKSHISLKEKGRGKLKIRIRQATISNIKEFQHYFKQDRNIYHVKLKFGQQELTTKHNNHSSIWNEDMKLKVFNETSILILEVYIYTNKQNILLGSAELPFTKIKSLFTKTLTLPLICQFPKQQVKQTGNIYIDADYIENDLLNQDLLKNDPGMGVLYLKPLQAELLKILQPNKPVSVSFQLQDHQVSMPINCSQIDEQKQVIFFRNITKFDRDEFQNTIKIKLMQSHLNGYQGDPPKFIGKGEINLLDFLHKQEESLQNHQVPIQIYNETQRVGKLNLQIIFKTREKDKLPVRPFLQSTKIQINKLMQKHFEAQNHFMQIVQRVVETEFDLNVFMNEIDTDRSNSIEMNELNNIMSKYGLHMSREQVQLLFIRLDSFDPQSKGIARQKFIQIFMNKSNLYLQD